MQCEKKKAGRLHRHLTELRLPSIRRCYRETAIAARSDNWEYESYLLELAERERVGRRNARTARPFKEPKPLLGKNLKAFNRKRLPREVYTQLTQFLKGKFLDHKENVLAFGNPGSVKPQLLYAVAQELAYQGRQVRFTPLSPSAGVPDRQEWPETGTSPQAVCEVRGADHRRHRLRAAGKSS